MLDHAISVILDLVMLRWGFEDDRPRWLVVLVYTLYALLLLGIVVGLYMLLLR